MGNFLNFEMDLGELILSILPAKPQIHRDLNGRVGTHFWEGESGAGEALEIMGGKEYSGNLWEV